MRERGRVSKGGGTDEQSGRRRSATMADAFFLRLSVRFLVSIQVFFLLSVPNVDSILRWGEMITTSPAHTCISKPSLVGLDILVAKKDGGAYSPSSAPNGLDYFMF